MTPSRREAVRCQIQDLVSCLLYDDRKGDAVLPVGAIEAGIADGEYTVEDLVRWFREVLEPAVRRPGETP